MNLFRGAPAPRRIERFGSQISFAAASQMKGNITRVTSTKRSFNGHLPFSSSSARLHEGPISAGDRNEQKDQRASNGFEGLDILGNTPVPSTSVDICLEGGFRLNNGIQVSDGSGILLVGGEAFAWRPWAHGKAASMMSSKMSWEVDKAGFGLLSLVWPRPDLLILGLGREIRPLSPEMKRYISALGMRVEVLDTRNAASQFNLLATERGIDDIAAALVPIGWQGGISS